MRATTHPPHTAQIGRLQADIGQKALVTHWGPAAKSPRCCEVTDEIGWRLAGLADGEGCFAINKTGGSKPKTALRCEFIVGMRSDDRPFLELMQEAVGVGRLYDITPTIRTLESRPGTNPQTHWRVARFDDCIALVNIFDRYPPLSKKGNDYVLWRKAVIEWSWGKWDLMAELRDALMASREYVG